MKKQHMHLVKMNSTSTMFGDARGHDDAGGGLMISGANAGNCGYITSSIAGRGALT